MIDLETESLVTFAEAAKSLPGRPNISTLHRWRLSGCRGTKLETCLIGGRRYTSLEALSRFIQRNTEVQDGETAPTRTSRQRERAIQAAEKELDDTGI